MTTPYNFWARLVGIALLLTGPAQAHGAVAPSVPVRLDVQPPAVTLASQRSRAQFVVTGHYADGSTRDLTREARYVPTLTTLVEVRDGVALPRRDGRGAIVVRAAGRATTVPVEVSGQGRADRVRFRTEVLPVLTRQGCNSGSCHGAPDGRGGFALSLFGYAPHLDEEALVRGGLNRRVTVINPADSLLLKKPLLRVAHLGGKRLSKSDIGYRLLHDWIKEGARLDDSGSPTCARIDVSPFPARVMRFPHVTQQVRVVAHFSDGTSKDITPLATYDVSHKDVLSVEPSGVVTGLKRGQSAVTVRYLHHLVSVYFTVVQDVDGFRWNDPAENNYVDALAHAKLKQLQYLSSETCDDSTFVRRIYLDLTGLLPTARQARAFLADRALNKRARLIDELLATPEFARYWALKTADLMRVNSQVLRDGRAEQFGRWIFESYRDNVPFDKFATRVLTASGDARSNPAVNYFLAVKTNEDLAETTAQLFMGSRINCAKCHNHPFENWTQEDYYRLGAVFARVKAKGTALTLLSSGETTHPASGQALAPWGAEGKKASGDRREAFARWLTRPGNPFFARVEVNRIWANLLGRGIVHPVDDFRSSNPPANVELLDALARDFERKGFDRKHVIRTICNSRTYQRSSATNRFNEDEDQLFSHALVRRLSAEQLHDAIGYVTRGVRDPAALDEEAARKEKERAGLTKDPKRQAALGTEIQRLRDRTDLATQRPSQPQSEFLRTFGQPRREGPCACDRSEEPTVDQALQVLNGKLVRDRLAATTAYATLSDAALVEEVYLAAFARLPRPAERQRVTRYLAGARDRREAIQDVVWALLNTQEFLFQH